MQRAAAAEAPPPAAGRPRPADSARPASGAALTRGGAPTVLQDGDADEKAGERVPLAELQALRAEAKKAGRDVDPVPFPPEE